MKLPSSSTFWLASVIDSWLTRVISSLIACGTCARQLRAASELDRRGCCSNHARDLVLELRRDDLARLQAGDEPGADGAQDDARR